jgi:hypothetical protein
LVDIVRNGNVDALKQIAQSNAKDKILITTRMTERESPGRKTLLHYALEQFVKDPTEARKEIFRLLEKRIRELNEEKRLKKVKSRITPFALDDDSRHILHTYAMHRSRLDTTNNKWLLTKLKSHLNLAGNNGLSKFQHALKTPTSYKNGMHTVRNILHNLEYHGNAQNLTPAVLRNNNGRITNVSPLNTRSHATRAQLKHRNGKHVFAPRTGGNSNVSALGRFLATGLNVNSNNNGEVESKRIGNQKNMNMNHIMTYRNYKKTMNDLDAQVESLNTGKNNLKKIYTRAKNLRERIASANYNISSKQKNGLKEQANRIMQVSRDRILFS